jgi:hypothetical protein
VDVWEAEAEGRAEAIMAGRVVRNDRWDREALLTALPGRTFVIPPRAAFLMVHPPPPTSLCSLPHLTDGWGGLIARGGGCRATSNR